MRGQLQRCASLVCTTCCETGGNIARMESRVGLGATIQVQREDYLTRPAAFNLMYSTPLVMEAEPSEMSLGPMAICNRTREQPLSVSELVSNYRDKRNKYPKLLVGGTA